MLTTGKPDDLRSVAVLQAAGRTVCSQTAIQRSERLGRVFGRLPVRNGPEPASRLGFDLRLDSLHKNGAAVLQTHEMHMFVLAEYSRQIGHVFG